MWFCGEKSGFVSSVAISVLLVGLVVYYFNIRLRALERTAQKQNQVLASFIGGVQGDIAQGELRRASATLHSGGAPAAGAIHAAKAALCRGMGQCSVDVLSGAPRITVSDDEGSDCTSDTESGSEASDTYSDEAESYSEAGVTEEDQALEPARDSVKVIDLEPDVEVVGNTADSDPPAVDEAVSTEKSETIVETPGDGDGDSETPPAVSNDPEGDAIQPETLRVGELRDLAVERGILTPAEARGMKKAGLLQALEGPAESPLAE